MLSNRQKLVLKAIVEEYVKTMEPVGSKSLTTNMEFAFNVSPATIRNDMAYIEELGLIIKEHTSSGRIPSEEGYRVYVKNMMEEKKEYQSFPLIDEIFARDTNSREMAIKESMNLVADLTNYASIVLGGYSYKAKIKKLQFVELDESHGVILMVTNKGYVESKKILIPDDVSPKDINKVINILNEKLYDCPISDIDQVIKERMNYSNINNSIDYYDTLMSVFIRTFTEMAKDKYFLSGQSKILSQPEFQDINKVKNIMDAIEKQEIFQVVDVKDDGISVKIGKENRIKAMEDCTVITVPYETDNGDKGAIAVFGPTRMEYQKIIPLLEYIAKNIKNIT